MSLYAQRQKKQTKQVSLCAHMYIPLQYLSNLAKCRLSAFRNVTDIFWMALFIYIFLVTRQTFSDRFFIFIFFCFLCCDGGETTLMSWRLITQRYNLRVYPHLFSSKENKTSVQKFILRTTAIFLNDLNAFSYILSWPFWNWTQVEVKGNLLDACKHSSR